MATIDLKLKTYDQLVFEITRLNTDKYLLEQKLQQKENIINELEKWLEERLEKLDIVGDDDIYMALEIALNKLQELKGSEMKNDKRSNN